MFSVRTRIHVLGLTSREITDFLSTCDDEAYQQWWPGTHLQLHTVRGEAGSVGSTIYMDEYIGHRRVRARFDVVELIPGKKVRWQLRWLIRLPVTLAIQFEDDDSGVWINHAIHVGLRERGSVLDPLFRLWFSTSFAQAMDEHVRAEFPKLRDLLASPDWVGRLPTP